MVCKKKRILVWTIIPLYVISLIASGTLVFLAAKGYLSLSIFTDKIDSMNWPTPYEL